MKVTRVEEASVLHMLNELEVEIAQDLGSRGEL